ncbi:MAG: hypothetical protein JRN42_04510 [Nitrososphaerota archaeon]|nr:hypothetical protein [Nitrososphaerota archaeon]
MIESFARTYFTPEDDVKSVVDGLPASASRSLDVEIYGLTDMVLVGRIAEAADRGVAVRVMNDRSQAAGPADARALRVLAQAKGVEVRVVESERRRIDHMKAMVVDGALGAVDGGSSVAWGSYNFSDGAQDQDNALRHTNDAGEVARFMAKFDHDWADNVAKPEWQVQPPPVSSDGGG